ncbi:VG15 protein [Streptomyces chrestomyceticus]|uniref:VG15 protein n=1 Tax=Streptomyces chrestomyceticus TaxID=68185 RepID=UPI0037BACAAB
MTQRDIDRASLTYYREQLAISAGLVEAVVRWWRSLSWRAVQTDHVELWGHYRDIVNECRTRSFDAGREYYNEVRELATDHRLTLGGGDRDAEAEEREAAASFFTHTAPIAREIQRGRLDDPDFLAELDSVMRRVGTNLARDGARLAEQGGRDALREARENDDECIGYYRMTDANPCGFCAMLASRGLVYTETRNASRRTRTWVDDQDPDQYHPDCHCQTLPLFRGVAMPANDRRKAEEYERIWRNTPGSGAEQLKNFRDRFDADRRSRRTANG